MLLDYTTLDKEQYLTHLIKLLLLHNKPKIFNI